MADQKRVEDDERRGQRRDRETEQASDEPKRDDQDAGLQSNSRAPRRVQYVERLIARGPKRLVGKIKFVNLAGESLV